jgi:hypothetical protein
MPLKPFCWVLAALFGFLILYMVATFGRGSARRKATYTENNRKRVNAHRHSCIRASEDSS